MTLITSVYAACLAVLASGKKIKHTFGWIVLAAICGIAALVTLTRSLGIVMLIVIPIFGMIRYRSAIGSIRVFAIPIMLVLAFGTVAALSEFDLMNQYLERFGRLSEELDPLSSPRLLDTAQGMREVGESPVFGTGHTDPQDFKSDVGKDTHGLVSLGLVGGIPLVILTLVAIYHSVRMGLRSPAWQRTAGLFIVVQVVVLMAINTFPGFVWIRSLVPAVIGMAMATSFGETAGYPNSRALARLGAWANLRQ
jgi:O-antigen ligase